MGNVRDHEHTTWMGGVPMCNTSPVIMCTDGFFDGTGPELHC